MGFALDTLAYARRLRDSGLSEQQAEGQARALAAAMTDSFTTKQDLHEIETHVDGRFEQAGAHMEVRFAQFDTRFAQAAAQMDIRFAQVDTRFEQFAAQMDVRFAQVDTRFEQFAAQMDVRFAQVDTRFEQFAARFVQIDHHLVEMEKRIEIRLSEQEKRIEIRFSEQNALFSGQLSALEHRMTLRLGGMMIAAIGAFSAIVKLL